MSTRDMDRQQAKAERFLALHHSPTLLVLPNIWDPLGARILQHHGFPAVATASAAIAYSLGKDDGEQLDFPTMLGCIRRIATAVDVPLTADIESGYAEDLEQLVANIRQVIQAGAVGINIEDSPAEGKELRPLGEQCERIRTARKAAELEGLPLVINARIDTFLGGYGGPREAKVAETIRRGRAYAEAGADCLYPIGPGDIETLIAIREGTGAPINVYAHPGTASASDLEAAGISRLSFGPNVLRAAYGAVRTVAERALGGGTFEGLADGAITHEEMLGYLSDK